MERIRKAELSDLGQILQIYENARQFMAANGNPNQWGKTNPPRETLERDIKLGQLYVVVREESIRGVFAFIPGEDPTYRYIEGSWRSNEPYAAIHRVASDGSGGILAAAVAFGWERIPHLRIDTHADNWVMQRAIERAGFEKCGTIYLEDGSPRIAYEKI